MSADTDRPKFLNPLKLKRWMTRIFLEQLVIFIGQLLDIVWESAIEVPEV
ncbi:MAG: hypothetical protein HY759_03895 [Nitrospirae bacterium]|nr:hypothetical protein [Nitrospirota bacterium]